jgi:hypothetical protein
MVPQMHRINGSVIEGTNYLPRVHISYSLSIDILENKERVLKIVFEPVLTPVEKKEKADKALTSDQIFNFAKPEIRQAWSNISNTVLWDAISMINEANKNTGPIKVGGHPSASSSSLQIMLALELAAKRGFLRGWCCLI